MNKFRILPFALILAVFSCEESEAEKNESKLENLTGESGISYNESLSKWNDLKRENGNSYIYQTSFNSWTGFGSITNIKIEDGIVTSRSYTEFGLDELDNKVITDSYEETIDNLGSHQKGASAVTIDMLYETCASQYIVVDEKDNSIHFETEESGLMNTCGFVPNGCIDDCFTGIQISAFDWIK
ncbi:MAG: hypothetical protein JXR03_10750 [Cyclobacteriaceae bacterium]